MSFIGSGWCLKAEQGTSMWEQVLLQLLSPPSPPPPTVLRLDLGWCSTQTAFMRPLQTVWSRLRSAMASLLLLALAPGEQAVLFSLASKTAGTDWFLAFSCCHVGWWSILPRTPPSTLPTTGRMGVCGPSRWVLVPTRCPSTQTVGPCSSGSRPWEEPRRSRTLGVSSLWGGSTPNQHRLLVECANSIFTPQHKLPCTTATIWKLSAGGPTLTDCQLLVWIWRLMTHRWILWSTPWSESRQPTTHPSNPQRFLSSNRILWAGSIQPRVHRHPPPRRPCFCLVVHDPLYPIIPQECWIPLKAPLWKPLLKLFGRSRRALTRKLMRLRKAWRKRAALAACRQHK